MARIDDTMMAADQQIAKDAEQLSVQLGELRARLFRRRA
jgi:chromosome partitioning protein